MADDRDDKSALAVLMPGGGPVERILGGLVALLLFSMMALVFVDVFARYLFTSPIPGGFEITEILMLGMFFAALPLATAREQHVTISLLDNFLSPGARQLQKVVFHGIAAIAVAYLSWLLWQHAAHISSWGDYTAHLELPLGPVVYFAAAMASFSTLVIVLLVWRYVRGRNGGEAR